MPYELIPLGAVGAKLAYDVLGPPAKSTGKQLAKISDSAARNLKRVLDATKAKMKALGKTQGKIPSRVLVPLLQQACVCEDVIQVSYLGGVWASACTEIPRDDRAVSYLAMIESLSTYQIRTHAIMYSCILRIPEKAFQKARKHILRGDATVILREEDYLKAMDFNRKEQPDIISHHAFIGLEQKGLSFKGERELVPHPKVSYSDVTTFQQGSLKEVKSFRYFYPTPLGIDLFLWGIGIGDKGLAAYEPDLLDALSFPFEVTPYQVSYGQTTYG